MAIRSAAEKAILRDAKKLTDAAIARINKNGDKVIDDPELTAAMTAMERNNQALERASQGGRKGQLSEDAKGLMLVFQGLSRLEDSKDKRGYNEAKKTVDVKTVTRHTDAAVRYMVDLVKKPPSDETGPFALLMAAMMLPKSAGPWVAEQVKQQRDG